MTDGQHSSGADRDHWPRHARQWALVGPPLRPCAEDVAVAEAVLAVHAAPRALILGVTPELVGLRWPAGSRITAVERAPAVIDAMVASHGLAGATLVAGDWRALACADACFDVALGDGSPSNLVFPADYRRLAGELARVLVRGGDLVLRLFAAPRQRESLDEVAAALARGEIGSFHALKWRLAMAVTEAGNVAVADIARAFDRAVPDLAALAAQTGWPRDVIATIDVYRGSELVYSFPTLDEVRAVFAPRFAHVATHVPGYELGARCPTVVLRRT